MNRKKCTVILLAIIILSFNISQSKESKNKQKLGTVVTPSGIYLMSSPSILSKKIEYVPFGENINILQGDDKWVKINYSGKQGWVADKFIWPGDHRESAKIYANIYEEIKSVALLNINKIQKSRISLNLNSIRLFSRSSHGCCYCSSYEYTESIIFNDKYIKYTSKHISEGIDTTIIKEGEYFINNELEIIINFNKTIINERYSKIEKSEIPNMIILYWISDLNGFVSDKIFKKLKSENIIVNTAQHYLITKEGEFRKRLCEAKCFLPVEYNYELFGYYYIIK